MRTRLGLLLATFTAVSGIASAADGDFDPTFGENGVALAGPDYFSGRALAVQPDGRILVCSDGWSNDQSDFNIVRFAANGSLDTSFGLDGRVIVDLGSSEICGAIRAQADGRIVAAGLTTTGDPAWGYGDYAVVRLDADGSLDTSFGAGTGRVVLSANGISGGAAGLAIQADNKIVMVGDVDSDAVAVRLRVDGSLDDAFGSEGFRTLFAGYASDVAIDGDNRIVVAGTYDAVGIPNQFAAARLLPSGAFDPDFGDDGVATAAFGPGPYGSSAFALALQGNGRIALAGYMNSALTGDENWDMAVACLSPNGSLDTTFSNDGKVVVPFDLANNGFDLADNVVWQHDGKLMIGGRVEAASGHTQGAIARFDSDGSLDDRFGDSGKRAFAIGDGPGAYTRITGLAMQGTRVIGAGTTSTDGWMFKSFAVRFSSETVFANGFD